MATSDPTEDPLLVPVYEPKEREELTSLGFFVAEIAKLRGRGLIPVDSYITIDAETHSRRAAIERAGNYRAVIGQVSQFKNSNPPAALNWAERARTIDPSKREAWEAAVDLYRSTGDSEKAAVLCEMAVAKFADFPFSPEKIREEAAAQTRLEARLSQAREAIQGGNENAAIAISSEILDTNPDQYDALALQAFALQLTNELQPSLTLYRKLQSREPGNAVWTKWIADIERKLADRPASKTEPTTLATTPLASKDTDFLPDHRQAVHVEPRVTWSEVTGEFLQDHWQKLILCLAVLLIVVSSNVGAYQVLGERLWNPEGKTLLALVYTAMFAIFGAGLVRWGAERAGRIMLLTTLIVVPANFMLAGQMKLLTEPSASRLAVLIVDACALFLLIRLVAISLRLPKGKGFLTVALFALSVFNAGASQGSPWPWSLQFTIFLAPALIFLASVVWITTGFQAGSFKDRHETTYFALALLAFAFLTGLVRTGVFALELIPTFYAIPAMLTAVACVRTSRAMALFDPDPQRIAWMRFAGLLVSGLAFALALARPPEPSALVSGNTFFAAIFGLALYMGLLWKERVPAYLYFAFGAMFLAYFGAFYFVRDLAKVVEEAVKSGLGYGEKQKLPQAFKAINGLVFNPILAALSLFFIRKWDDKRLARHCHYIGVPFSIAACLFSGFEPKAALICLSGYAVLYTVAVWLFTTPWLIYLATAACAGAVYFGTTLMPDVTLAQRGLLGSLLGIAYWSIGPILTSLGVDPSYRRPLMRAALGMSTLALVVAISSTLGSDVVPLPAALSLLFVTGIAVLVNHYAPNRMLGYYAVLSGNFGLILLANWAGWRWGNGDNSAQFAATAGAIGLAGAILGNRLRRFEGMNPSPWNVSMFPSPLFKAAAVQVGLTLLGCATHASSVANVLTRLDFATFAIAFGLAGLTLALLTRPYPYLAVANTALACGLGVWVCGFQLLTDGAVSKIAAYGAVISVYSLLLITIEEMTQKWVHRRDGLPHDVTARPGWLTELNLFAVSLAWFELGTVAIGVGLCALGWENSQAVAFTFSASAVAMLWSTRLRSLDIRVHAASILAVCAVFSFTVTFFPNDPRILGVQALASVILALAFLAAWRSCSNRPDFSLYRQPFLQAASVLTLLVFGLAIFGTVSESVAYRVSAGALVLNIVPILILAEIRRGTLHTFRAIASGVVSVYVVALTIGDRNPENAYLLGLIAIILALFLSAIGFAFRLWPNEADDRDRLYAGPLFASSLLLTLVGVLLAFTSPVSMLLAGLSFILFVKSLPARQWLYATVGCLVCAFYHAVLIRWPEERLASAALGIGFGLWLLALIVKKVEPTLTSLLALENEGYDYPIFNSALIAAIACVWIRSVAILHGTTPWSYSAPLVLGLAVFSFLMIKPYPSVIWVHFSVTMATFAAGLAVGPKIEVEVWWLTLGMGLALFWLAVSITFQRYGEAIYRLAGVPNLQYSQAPLVWSRRLFALTSGLIALIVGILVLVILFGSTAPETGKIWAWAALLFAIGMGAVYLTVAGWRENRVTVVMALTAALVMAVWWLAAPISPLVANWGVNPLTLLPLSTAAMAVGVVASGLGLVKRPGWTGPFWKRRSADDEVARLDAFALQGGLALALLAAMFTRGTIGNTTVGTLFLTTLAAGLAAVGRRWVPGAYAAAISWCAAGAFACLDGLRKFQVVDDGDIAIFLALGLLASLSVLMVVAGYLSRKDERVSESATLLIPAPNVSVALEQVAAFAWLFAASIIAISPFLFGHPDTAAAVTGVAVLFGLTLASVGLIARWRHEWLVYPAQSTLIGAYLYYRWAFPLPASADAVVLTLFGYTGLGLAEVMHRVGLGRYARPTMYAAFVMPLLPIGIAIMGWLGTGQARLNDVHLFIVFAAAAFYSVACYTTRWRWLGYAAAVLYNAFLWYLWGRVGFSFSDRPQFFLIPVGLSAILFAEDNRKMLGRQAVNAIRGVGLSLIYLSLASPIWQFQSLGAWVTLLLLSLAGIFVGIGLRVQVFLWFGLTTFVLDVVYQLGKMGTESSLAKWGIMLVLGILLVVFVALNEKKKIVESLKVFYDDARAWE